MITPKFIFARYNEDIDWIYDYPLIANNSIIYNKGNFLEPKEIFKTRIIPLSNFPNYGRESDTYLKHIVNNYKNLDEYTIFSQADPFEHCPEFIDIVHYMFDKQHYKPYQPLSCGWKLKEGVPPVNNILYDNREYIDKYKLYMELVDDNLNVLGYTDRGIIPVLTDFKHHFRADPTIPLLYFIYRKLSLSKPYCGFIKFNYGGIFGVNKYQILVNSRKFYFELNKFVLEHYTAGFIMERFWYTIFKNNL